MSYPMLASSFSISLSPVPMGLGCELRRCGRRRSSPLLPPPPPLKATTSRTAKLSLGCPILDRLICGGLPAGSDMEIGGKSASGKTQLCLQLDLCSDLPFPLRSLRRLAPQLLPRHPRPRPHHRRPLPHRAPLLLSRAQLVLSHSDHSPHRLPIHLILLDSIASLFRTDFDAGPRELLSDGRRAGGRATVRDAGWQAATRDTSGREARQRVRGCWPRELLSDGWRAGCARAAAWPCEWGGAPAWPVAHALDKADGLLLG